jgi:hypothetical protein
MLDGRCWVHTALPSLNLFFAKTPRMKVRRYETVIASRACPPAVYPFAARKFHPFPPLSEYVQARMNLKDDTPVVTPASYE